MRKATLAPLVLVVVLIAVSTSPAKDKAVKATTPLSADELAIYKSILQQYSFKEPAGLHVSSTTHPLNPDSPMNGLGMVRQSCSKR